MVLNPAARKAMIDRLVDLANTRGFAGYVMDLEELSPQALRAYPGFLAQVRAALRPLEQLWATAPLDEDQPWPLKTLQDNCDALVLMAFDEHYQTSEPGPPASQSWLDHVSQELRRLDPNRTIVALGNYGYDSPKEKGAKKFDGADPLTFSKFMVRANNSGVDIDYDSDALNPTYRLPDDDRPSTWSGSSTPPPCSTRSRSPTTYGPRGYALWRMGAEDPAFGPFRARATDGRAASGLADRCARRTGADFDGQGEVLHVHRHAQGRQAQPEIDSATGLISDETYDVMPTGYVIQRYGCHPGKVALTFDDGPDGALDAQDPRHSQGRSRPTPPSSSSARTWQAGPAW